MNGIHSHKIKVSLQFPDKPLGRFKINASYSLQLWSTSQGPSLSSLPRSSTEQPSRCPPCVAFSYRRRWVCFRLAELQEGEWDPIHQNYPVSGSMDTNVNKLWEIVEDRKAWHVVVHGVAKSWTQLSDSTTTTKINGESLKDFII